MEAPWPSGFCSSCPHQGPPSHIAYLEQTSIQTTYWFTTQPQQPTNKPVTQLSAYNLMSAPSHCLQTPIFWQEVRNIPFRWGIEPVLLRCELVVLTTMPPLLTFQVFHSLFIAITTAQNLPLIHCSSQPLRKTFFPAPSSPGINSNQSTSAAAHLSPFPDHPIPTLFTDPPVTIWPSPKIACPFDSNIHPILVLVHVHIASPLTHVSMFLSSLPIQFPPYSQTLLLPSHHHPK